MKSEIEYVYNKLKQLRFDFKESDRKLFPNEYTFDYGLNRYVRKDGNDLYISKDTFKPLEEELEYADKMHNLEEQIGCPLDVVLKIKFGDINYVYDENGDRFFINGGEIFKSQFAAYRRTDTEFINKVFKWADYGKTWWTKKDKEE